MGSKETETKELHFRPQVGIWELPLPLLSQPSGLPSVPTDTGMGPGAQRSDLPMAKGPICPEHLGGKHDMAIRFLLVQRGLSRVSVIGRLATSSLVIVLVFYLVF